MVRTKILHYKILEKIGEGGMGVVYKAEDTRLKRDVAIKFLPRDIAANETHRKRFVIEAQAAAALNHPNIATIHAIEEVDDAIFIVMEYIEGQELKERIEGGTLDANEAIDCVLQIAKGLAVAHSKGIVHRDIKSANIMITASGQVKIMDFGLAKVGSGMGLTKELTTLGTVAYMSPELVMGEDTDYRTDIWSLGVLLYEAITGQLPFRGEFDQVIMYKITKENPKPLTEVRTNVSVELEQIVNKMLEKNIEKRYQSVNDIQLDLRKLQNEPVDILKVRQKISLPLKSKAAIYISALTMLVLFVIAALVFLPKEKGLPDVTVAVFENETGDEKYDKEGVAAAQFITMGLHQTGMFAVYPVAVLEDGDKKLKGIQRIKKIARLTGAKTIISGGYLIQDKNLNFFAQVNNANGEIVSSIPSVSCPADSPMAAIEQIRQKIMGALAQKFSARLGRFVKRSRPPRHDALVEFNRGLFSRQGSHLSQALVHYKKAAEIDPEFYSAHLAIATCYMNMHEFLKADSILTILDNNRNELSPFEQFFLDRLFAILAGDRERALRYARELAKLDPSVELAIGQDATYTNHLQESINSFRKLEPNSWWWVNFYRIRFPYHMLGRHQEELEALNLYQKKSPEMNLGRTWELKIIQYKAEALSALGKIDEVEALIDRCFNLEYSSVYTPGRVIENVALELRAHGYKEAARKILVKGIDWHHSHQSDNYRFRNNLAELLYQSERWEDAKVIIDSLITEYPDKKYILARLGTIHARLSDREEALAISEQLVNFDWKFPYEVCEEIYGQARIAAILGEKDKAVKYLWEAYRKGYAYNIYIHRDMDLESLRGYPPYEKFMEPKE